MTDPRNKSVMDTDPPPGMLEDGELAEVDEEDSTLDEESEELEE